jgi:predicted nuclease of predicted toxin-antitoxin system
MTLRLYMDHHVRGAITWGLRRRGVDVLTAHEDGCAQLGDAQLLERAFQLGRILFTQDDDLLEIADRWQQTGRHFAGVIYAHQMKITIGQAVRDLELIAEASDPDDMRNSVQFLPLR